jgi:putative permease
MLDVMRGWLDRYLSDEESIIFAAMLITFFVVVITMGTILAPLLTGIVLAYVMQGVIKLLSRYQLPKTVAVLVTFVMFLGGFIAFLFFVIPLVWRQMRNLFEELPAMINQSRALLDGLPEDYPLFISEQQVRSWGELLTAEAGDIGQWVLSFSLSQLPVVIAVLVYMMLVPILVFFLLKDRDQIIEWAASFLPERRPLMNRIAAEMDLQMANYIRGKFVEFLIVGISSYMYFALFGLHYAALLAFLVGLSVIVPYLGLIAVTIPVVIIGYLQFGWSAPFLYIVVGYTVIQSIDGAILVPLLFSEAVNLHPIAIITAVLVFGSWWGVWGVFFAIPLATLVKAIITAWPTPEVEPL